MATHRRNAGFAVAVTACPITDGDREQIATALEHLIKNAQPTRHAVFRDLGIFVGSSVVDAGWFWAAVTVGNENGWHGALLDRDGCGAER